MTNFTFSRTMLSCSGFPPPERDGGNGTITLRHLTKLGGVEE